MNLSIKTKYIHLFFITLLSLHYVVPLVFIGQVTVFPHDNLDSGVPLDHIISEIYKGNLMALIELKDIKIEYQEFIPDKENYETIIFMHGRGGNLLSWFQQIPFFVKEYKCIVYSQRGFGHSYDNDNSSGLLEFPKDDLLKFKFMSLPKASLVFKLTIASLK